MKGSVLSILFAPSVLGFQYSSPLTNIGNPHNSLAAVRHPRVAFSPLSNQNFVARSKWSRANVFSLGMAAEEDDAAASEEKEADKKEDAAPTMEEKIAGRKKRVIGGYKIMTATFALFGSMLIAKTKTPFFGAPSLMAAGISYIMIGAAENDRLASDTYKRLNIALFEFGAAGFLAGVGMRLGVSFNFSAAWLLMFFVSIVNSIKGYGYGLKGWELGDAGAGADLTNGMKANLKTMTQIPNIKSAGYLVATLFIGFLKMQKLVQVFCGRSLSQIVNPLIGLARLMVMTIALFTLKDAADRDRLEGTTFIQLNALSSLSFLSWATFHGTAGTPLRPALGAISGFTAINAVLSQLKKKKAE